MVEFQFLGSAKASFSASHVVAKHPRCGRSHGHRWSVEVTIQAGQDPATGELVGLPELADGVEQLADELDREDINLMLPASPPTPAGVALAFRERLSMVFGNIVSVQVWMDDASVVVRRG